MEAATSFLHSNEGKRPVISRRRMSWSRFLVDQLPTMFIALVISVGVYRISMMAMTRLDTVLKPTQEMSMSALEVLYEDLQELRQEAKQIKGYMQDLGDAVDEVAIDQQLAAVTGAATGAASTDAKSQGYKMDQFEAMFGITPINSVVRPSFSDDANDFRNLTNRPRPFSRGTNSRRILDTWSRPKIMIKSRRITRHSLNAI
jgi:hypothetical protein